MRRRKLFGRRATCFEQPPSEAKSEKKRLCRLVAPFGRKCLGSVNCCNKRQKHCRAVWDVVTLTSSTVASSVNTTSVTPHQLFGYGLGCNHVQDAISHRRTSGSLVLAKPDGRKPARPLAPQRQHAGSRIEAACRLGYLGQLGVVGGKQGRRSKMVEKGKGKAQNVEAFAVRSW